MKKIMLLVMSALLVGCGENIISSTSTSNSSIFSSESNIGENLNANALVVYFSATGYTKEVAEIISNYIASPLHELLPIDPYTNEDLDYLDSDSRVSQERNDPNHLTELTNVDFSEFSESDYLFIGAPVWWGELSWVINDFVISNDFTNKTIIPFATASSSNFSIDELEDLAPEANVLQGRRFRHSEIEENVIHSWIDSLDINLS